MREFVGPPAPSVAQPVFVPYISPRGWSAAGPFAVEAVDGERLELLGRGAVYPALLSVYTWGVTKRLIDVDDDALDAARAQLGTRTIKDTVNEALRQAARQRSAELTSALSVLAAADLDDRSATWR